MWNCQCLKCNGTQGNAVPPPPISGSKRFPTSDCYNVRERHTTIVRGPNLNVAFPHLNFCTLTTGNFHHLCPFYSYFCWRHDFTHFAITLRDKLRSYTLSFVCVQRVKETTRAGSGDQVHQQDVGADDMAVHRRRRPWGRCLYSPWCRQPSDATWCNGRRWLAETESREGSRIPLCSRPPKSLEVPGEWRSVGRPTTSAWWSFQRQASISYHVIRRFMNLCRMI